MKDKKFIPLSVPHFAGNERRYVDEAIDTEWVSTGGAFITRFEKEMAAYLGVGDAVACQSGTAGLHLAMLALGIGAGDEVIVPTLTFIAAVNPVRYVGAEPVFMDCDDTLCLDVEKVRQFCEEECDFDGVRLTDRQSGKRVAAVVAVHVFGNLADMDALMELAGRYHLSVIEDATEALGSYFTSGAYAVRYGGTAGDAGVYSFNGNKIITTGGGGMLVARDAGILRHCRHLSTQAKQDELYFVHDEIGYNYRMTNLQAALGLAQLEQLEEFVRIKNENYDRYRKQGISLLAFRDDIRANKWFYSCETEDRDGLIRHMGENGVQCRPIWTLIHTLRPYQGFRRYQIEKAVRFQRRVVNLPCSTSLTAEDVERVAELMKSYERTGGK